MNRTSPTETAVAYKTELDDLQGSAFIDVFSETEPNFAGLLGCSRASAYAEISRGDWPVIRSGRRVRLAVPALLRMLGED